MPSFLEKEGPVGLIARLVRSEAVINDDLVLPKANRVAFEFDCIDATASSEEALATIADRGDRTRLAVLKILTTADNFLHLADRAEFGDGEWYRINLLPRGKKPGAFAWASSLADKGYEETVPFVLDEIEYLFSDRDLPLSPIGAAVGDQRALAQMIAEASVFPKSAIGKSRAARKLLSGLRSPHRIVVRDVGQASFCSALDQNNNELFHLDAGWPVSYNKKTASRKPEVKTSGAPVILSHWDWDHLHGYHAIPGLTDSTWIAPVQHLGPGAALVAKKLANHGRLLGVSSTNLVTGPLRVGRCKGKKGDLNQTGLCVRVGLQSGETILFMGDADYNLVPPRMSDLPNFIVATHHGAKFGGGVIFPAANGRECVVSVGKGNGYGHPSAEAMLQHLHVGWSLRFTCERHGRPRGDRYFGPIAQHFSSFAHQLGLPWS